MQLEKDKKINSKIKYKQLRDILEDNIYKIKEENRKKLNGLLSQIKDKILYLSDENI